VSAETEDRVDLVAEPEEEVGKFALADDPLFDGLPGEYVPPDGADFDIYEPGDLRCPLDGELFAEWRGYDGPCESAHIMLGVFLALAPSLSFDDDAPPEEIPISLPARFTMSARHSVSGFGEHVLEARGVCDEEGVWRSSAPVRAWVWSDVKQRLCRVVWITASD
jgi:hypothetical protein